MNFGHSSTDNTVGVPAQMIPYPDPSIAGMQSSTSSSKQLFEPLQSLTSTDQQVIAIQKDFEKMNFGRKNFGHSSVENTIDEQAQKESHSGPSMASMQSSMSALKQLPDSFKSAASAEQPTLAIQRDLEKMNFGTENSGNGSTENTMVEPAINLPSKEAVKASIQRVTSRFGELLKSATSAEHLVAIQKAYPGLMALVIRRKITHCQLALQQQAKQLLQIEGSTTENHTMGQQVLNLDASILDGIRKNTSTLKCLYKSLSTVSTYEQQDIQAFRKANPHLKTAVIEFREDFKRERQNQQSLQAVLNESNITENHTVGRHEVFPNPDPTAVDMQSLTSTSVQRFETLPTVSAQQQDLAALKANPKLMALNLVKQLQQQIEVLNKGQLILQQHHPLQLELPQLLHREQRRSLQRKQRRQMLLEHDVAGYSTTRRSGRVVQNRDPSEAMQNLSELWPQLIESLTDLNLE